ncbi:hypothetical protein [Achromobacter xylosoxidans]|uniref:hypothetical protein n=1 Tax=Alcaligenes xylosoxydans xylosoxydans TaxID=85698 RepID=UPI001F14036D|nr:hypothetical protein [Achromobacter xylosoxidans]
MAIPISHNVPVRHYSPIDSGSTDKAVSGEGAKPVPFGVGDVVDWSGVAPKSGLDSGKPVLSPPKSGKDIDDSDKAMNAINSVVNMLRNLLALMLDMRKRESEQTVNSSMRETALARSMADKTRQIGTTAFAGGVSKGVGLMTATAVSAGFALKGQGKQLESTRENLQGSRSMNSHLSTTGAGADSKTANDLGLTMSKQIHSHEVEMIKGSRLQVHGSSVHQMGTVSGAVIEGAQSSATSVENASKEIDAGDVGVQGKTTDANMKQRSQRDETIAMLQSTVNAIAQAQIDVMPVVAQNTRV